MAVTLVAHMHQLHMCAPNVTRFYGMKQFKSDLKHVIQQAGIEAQPTLLLIEDHHLIEPQFLELVNDLLSSGVTLYFLFIY